MKMGSNDIIIIILSCILVALLVYVIVCCSQLQRVRAALKQATSIPQYLPID